MPACHFGFGGEADIRIAVGKELDEALLLDLAPFLAAVGAVAHARQQPGLLRPLHQLLDRRFVELIAQMVRGDIGIRKGAMRRQPAFVIEPRRFAPIAQYLVGIAGRIRPQPQRAFPCADPVRTVRQRSGAELLLERGAMRGEREAARIGIEHLARDIVPPRRVRDILIADMVHRLSDRGHRAARIDEDVAAVAVQFPAPVGAQRHILPADLAYRMRGRGGAGGFQIDHADQLLGRAARIHHRPPMWAITRANTTICRREPRAARAPSPPDDADAPTPRRSPCRSRRGRSGDGTGAESNPPRGAGDP